MISPIWVGAIFGRDRRSLLQLGASPYRLRRPRWQILLQQQQFVAELEDSITLCDYLLLAAHYRHILCHLTRTIDLGDHLRNIPQQTAK